MLRPPSRRGTASSKVLLERPSRAFEARRSRPEPPPPPRPPPYGRLSPVSPRPPSLSPLLPSHPRTLDRILCISSNRKMHISISAFPSTKATTSTSHGTSPCLPSLPSAFRPRRQQLHNRPGRDARRFPSRRFLSRHGTCAAKVLSRWPMTPSAPVAAFACCAEKESKRGREWEE